jgi:uncharacterized membrane protein HdeD (DUF308 family)
MTTYDSGTSEVGRSPPLWIRLLLGLVLIVGGLAVLGDVAFATLVSTIFIGFAAILVGAFEIVHAFWTKGWGGFLWKVLLGILYIIFGSMVINQPVSGALTLTFVLGIVLLASGLIRIFVGFTPGRESGWMMLLSGAFAVLAGLVVISGWPASGIWTLGLLLAIDLLSHGLAWLTYGWLPR